MSHHGVGLPLGFHVLLVVQASCFGRVARFPTVVKGDTGDSGTPIELITFEILAAERLRFMGFDNRLIFDCFANIVNILILLFSTNESNYLENPFPEMKGVNLLSKTHRNDKSNLKHKTVLQE